MSRAEGLTAKVWPRVGGLVTRLVEKALLSHSMVGGPDPLLFRPMVYGDSTRLHVDPTAVVNNTLFNLSSGEIVVGPHAFFGHNVCILTGTHDVEARGAQRQVAVPPTGRDVVVGEGAWVSSNVTVVGPCRIGEHAVVGVGSLVLDDVEPYTVVAGHPARLIRRLDPPADGSTHLPPADAAHGSTHLPPADAADAAAAG
ncbi:MAG: acyltransferase [Acidimicrobiales bacterium]